MAVIIAEHESLGGTVILVDNIETGGDLWAALDDKQAEYLGVLDDAKSRLEGLGVEPQEGHE